MFERYTDRARRVIDLANQAAWDMRHAEADTGHLLAGLIGEGGGVAFQALTALGVTAEMVREAVWNRHPGGGAAQSSHMRIGARLGKALELAERESLRMSMSYVATEHLLLGLIGEGEDVGALALADCGIGEGDRGFLGDVRRKVLELLHGYAKTEAGRNVRPDAYPAAMSQDAAEDAATLLPELPEPPVSFVAVITVPDDDFDRFLPYAPSGGGTVTGEAVLRMSIKARTLSEALILAAALGGWTKVPGARCEVRPA